MRFKEFGNSRLPKIVILHGGGLSWWSVEPLADILQQQYCIIIPVIDGHGEDGESTFQSIEDSAGKLISYIDNNFDGQIYALCGLSIGAQIVVEVLSRRSDICQYSIIESALVKPIKFLKSMLIPVMSLSYPLIKKRWYSKLQAKTLFVPEDKLELYFEDSCLMSKASLLNITLSNGSFSINPKLKETKSKVLILVGEKELKIMKDSAKELHEMIEGSTLQIIPGSGHGEISLLRPRDYCDLMFKLFE